MHSKIFTMTGGPTGELLDLGVFVPSLECVTDATGVAIVRAQLLSPTDTAPTAPVASPVPSAGSASTDGWEPIAANGKVTFKRDPLGLKGYRYVEIWGTAAGKLTASGG